MQVSRTPAHRLRDLGARGVGLARAAAIYLWDERAGNCPAALLSFMFPVAITNGSPRKAGRAWGIHGTAWTTYQGWRVSAHSSAARKVMVAPRAATII